MDERLIIGASVHIFGYDGYQHETCHAGVIVRILSRGGQIDIYRLPYRGYKNREEEGEVILDALYNPSCDVVGGWHWADWHNPLCRGYI